jgi:heptosyltransferase-3
MRRLIIRPGAIGDFIVSLPALEWLKTDYLEVWTHRRTVPLVRFADRVRAIDATGIELTGITQPPPDALAIFDDIVSWYGTNRPEFREAVRRLPFRFFPALPPDQGGIHATDFYLAQVGCAPGAIPRIECGAEQENFTVIQPFSGSARKNWPLQKFRALATHLERVMPVHWCSGADDPPLPDAVRIDDLWELGNWLARARVYVGNDSGVTHLAAAVGTPTLAIFRASDPAVWAPRGAHVRVVTVKMEA